MSKELGASALAGLALDAAVAKALGDPRISMWGDSPWIEDGSKAGHGSSGRGYKPSADWRDGGPIIERERITVITHQGSPTDGFEAMIDPGSQDPYITGQFIQTGPTYLIAAMRCFVAMRLGVTP